MPLDCGTLRLRRLCNRKLFTDGGLCPISPYSGFDCVEVDDVRII